MKFLEKMTVLCFYLLLCAISLSMYQHIHEFSEWVSVKDATCSDEGQIMRTCWCGEQETKLTEIKNHTITAEIDCVSPRECTACGKILEEPQGHNYKISEVDPTCVENGYTMYTCDCGDAYQGDEIPSTGHTFGSETDCETAQACTVCGATLSVALGHTPGAEADCENAQVCTVCGAILNAALGHIPGAETCTLPQTCTTCGKLLADAKGHCYTAVVTPPTYAQIGYTTYTCVCGHEYRDDYVPVKDSYEYVCLEAERVANEVRSHQNENTFSFIAISDMHYTEYWASIAESCLHAGQGMELVRQQVDIDFAVSLGDMTWGSSMDPIITTQEMGVSEILQANLIIEKAFAGIPNFRLIGNHDNLVYNYTTNGAYLSGSELFPMFGAYNEGAVYPSDETDGYCYRDFDEWKLRVICVNTTEDTANNPFDGTNMYVSPAQIQWFADTLDMSEKENASEWSILIFSHAPVEQMAATRMSEILEVYIEGTSYSGYYEGTLISCDYSGKNDATVIANVHGHNHNFQVDYLRKFNDDQTATTPIPARRICVPNACYLRSNERGMNDGPDLWDIEYGEEVTYEKTRDTPQDTAFSVFTIDPVEKKIYVTNYGAGYDREIDYSV